MVNVTVKMSADGSASYTASVPRYYSNFDDETNACSGVVSAPTFDNSKKSTQVTVTKAWKAADGSDLTWPEGATVTVALMNGDTQVDTADLTADSPSHTFTGLDAEGTYSVDEVSVPEGYTKSVDQQGTHFTVTNTHAAATGFHVSGAKTLTGRKLAAGEFTFQLKDAKSNVVGTAQNDAQGNFSIATADDLIKAAGTYTYTMSEAGGKLGGVTYDDHEATVTVSVKDDGKGKLVVTAVTTDAGATAFTNTYDASGSIELAGTKSLTGRKMVDSDDFTFTVKEGEKVVSTGKSGTDGKISFSAIDYTLADLGEHTYVITEDKAGQTIDGVTYSTASKTVVVNVTDNGDGTLKAEVVSEKSEPVTFTNTYAAEGSVTFTGTKTLTGRDMADGEFSFSVKDADGKVVSTGKADAKGNIAFAPISYTLADAGEHTYTVTEDAGKLGGVTYDSAAKTVVVNVTDNGDGTLKAEVVADKSDDIAFTNTYQAAETNATLKVTKSYNAWKDGVSFGFTLTGKDGAPMPEAEGNKATATNDAKTATFGDITFTKVGTYHYVITEDLPEGVDALHLTKDSITYDVAEHPVTVTVTDNGKGKLVVSKIDYDGKSSLKVKNTYTTEHHGGGNGGSNGGGSSSGGSSRGGTAQTGDATSYSGVAGLAAAGVALIALAVRRRKREQE